MKLLDKIPIYVQGGKIGEVKPNKKFWKYLNDDARITEERKRDQHKKYLVQ